MSYTLVGLAIATGIAPSVWADEGEPAIATAVDMLKEQQKQMKRGTRRL